jgi:peptidoglycan/LPS O-acetylase OafA/YrhL
MDNLTNRQHSLDILRSMAILLVLMYHYACFTDESAFGLFGKIGWFGVDIFFALSGYLIGNQIFSRLHQPHAFSIKVFYMRRFLRTLPNYLFVLALFYFVPIIRERALVTPLWKFLTFTENYHYINSAFSHVWSLCIEEQFYFVMPLLAFVIARYFPKQMNVWVFVGVILFGISARTWNWFTYLQHAGANTGHLYVVNIYYATSARLDELTLGVGIAFIKNHYPLLWNKLKQQTHLFLGIAIAGFGLCIYWFHNDFNYAFSPTVLGYLVLAISCTALLLIALSDHPYVQKLKIPGAKTLATLSYALYLINKPVMFAIHGYFVKHNLQHSFIGLGITALLWYVAALLLYRVIELPCLNLRDKISKRSVLAVPQTVLV